MLKLSKSFRKHSEDCEKEAKCTYGVWLVTNTELPETLRVKKLYINMLRRRTGISIGQAAWCWWNLVVAKDQLRAADFVRFMETEGGV